MSRVTAVTGPVTTDAVTGEQHQQKAELEYDADGNVTKTTARDLKTSDEPRVTTLEYDDRNRLSRTVDADGKRVAAGVRRRRVTGRGRRMRTGTGSSTSTAI